MRKFLRTIKRWSIAIYYVVAVRWFKKKLDTSVIPKGVYCYAPDTAKNDYAFKDDYTYHIIPCTYSMYLSGGWNCCKYLGIITDDFLFDDQCKMCSENPWTNEEVLGDEEEMENNN